MKRITYLQHSLHGGKVSRWPQEVMPLNIHIADYRWYRSKGEHEAYKYKQMVKDALEAWTSASGGIVSFNIVQSLYDSNINLEWKRVERKSLGNCHFNFDKMGRYYSAEVQIGLSDGIIHHKYMDEAEVYHTIVHEIGHALGLGHSPFKGDIMYVPHQYGVTKISQSDILTLLWLYRFDIGMSEKDILNKYSNINATDVDSLVAQLIEQKSEFQNALDNTSFSQNKDLIQENENIAELKKYLLELNNIKINYRAPKEDKNKPPEK